ncbi:MAG TPA: phosphate/phosphite/phosphonate ABC transporter substrate-binding protein [Caulobacteraceae bacterium]|jgi:phosphonate transport system substrate-binding protein|nr:phosphate/phosphite/phosphonate ABC transporter substrate-binding protein [Caulobacteraceae bacterium]
MIPRRALLVPALLALGASALGLLAGCSRPAAPDKGVVHFSVLSTDTTQVMSQYWQPILKDMERKTGLKIDPFYSNNYTLLVEAMRFKKTDAGWFSNQSGLEAVRRGGGEVFARTVNASGQDGYYSVLIAKKDRPITLESVLKCDKTLTFGLGDALSTSGTLAPMTYLFAPRDIDPNKCFKQVRSGSSHAANLFAVANGQLDVATNNSTSLLLNHENGRHEADAIKVIWRSPVLPEDPIVWRKDLDPALKEKLRQFFLTYGQGDTPEAARERGYMNKVNVMGFKAADDTHLLPVREMEATEHWIQAKASGDQARVAKAKAALDAIRADREALEARLRKPAADQ